MAIRLSVPPNGAIVNGVAHFITVSKPTVRVDGSPLEIGDRWYKSDDSTEWFWNGSYWLGEGFTVGSTIGVLTPQFHVGEDLRGLFVHYILAKGRTAVDPPNWDGSNYWECNLIYASRTISNLARLDSTTGYVGGPDLHFYRKFTLNTAMITAYPSAGGSNIITSQIRRTGRPTGAAAGSSTLSYFFNLSFIYL